MTSRYINIQGTVTNASQLEYLGQAGKAVVKFCIEPDEASRQILPPSIIVNGKVPVMMWIGEYGKPSDSTLEEEWSSKINIGDVVWLRGKINEGKPKSKDMPDGSRWPDTFSTGHSDCEFITKFVRGEVLKRVEGVNPRTGQPFIGLEVVLDQSFWKCKIWIEEEPQQKMSIIGGNMFRTLEEAQAWPCLAKDEVNDGDGVIVECGVYCAPDIVRIYSLDQIRVEPATAEVLPEGALNDE